MIKTARAKQLCTKVEFDLYAKSLPRELKGLTATRIKQKVKRARALRDKYRKLANQQAREARGKAKPRRVHAASGSLRTQQKRELFEQMLERFQAAARKAPAAATRKKTVRPPGKKTVVKKKVAKKKVAKKKVSKKTAAKKPASKKTVRKTAAKKVSKKAAKPGAKKVQAKRTRKKASVSESKVGRTGKRREAQAKASRFKRSGRIRSQTHISSRGRRNQAKADSRRR